MTDAVAVRSRWDPPVENLQAAGSVVSATGRDVGGGAPGGELLAGFVEALAEASLFVGLGGGSDVGAEGLVGVGDAPAQAVAFEGAGGGTPDGAGVRVGGWGAEFGGQPARWCHLVACGAVSARS